MMANSQMLPPFLGVAREIRDQIYGYLLSTKYTKHYPRGEDPEWEHNPGFGQGYIYNPRPTHVYRFHVGILGANRQINREASKVLYDENMFVEFKCDLGGWYHNFSYFGLPDVAQGPTASSFVQSVLHIELYPEGDVRCPGESPLHLIFAGADLPAFCVAFLLLGGVVPSTIFKRSLFIDLNCKTADEKNRTSASFSIPVWQRLLEPLRTLHSCPIAHVTGPLDEQYKTDLCLRICRKAPNFKESLSEVLKKVHEGDEAFNAQGTISHYRQAINLYNAAMTDLKDSCSRFYWETDERLAFPPRSEADVLLHNAYRETVFKLRVNLASSHYQLEEFVQSRKWSESAMIAIHSRHSLTFLDNEPNPGYAKAYLLHARSNNKLGLWAEATESIKEAVKLAPHLEGELKLFNEDGKRDEETQLKIVRMVLASGRNTNGRPLVMRYPEDFDRAKIRLSGQFD